MKNYFLRTMYSTHFSKHCCFLHISVENSNHRKRSPNTHTGKNSFGPLLIGNYRAKPEKHYHKVFFPKKETCDVSLDPRPKKKKQCLPRKKPGLGRKKILHSELFLQSGLQASPRADYKQKRKLEKCPVQSHYNIFKQ